MTTERDIRNQIKYAEKMRELNTREEIARLMLKDKKPMEEIIRYSKLPEEQIKAL